jgi:hypothetical protein
VQIVPQDGAYCLRAVARECVLLAGDAGGAGSEDCLKVNIYAPYGAEEGGNRRRNFTFLEVDSTYLVISACALLYPRRR